MLPVRQKKVLKSWTQKFIAWFKRRFKPGERFGLSLTAGLLMAVLSAWVFGELADEVVEQELLSGIDHWIGTLLISRSSWVGSVLFYSITSLGSTVVILPAFLIVCVWLWKRGQIRDVLAYLAAVAGGLLINLLLKSIFDRPRPLFPGAFYDEIGYSFPSGHAMISVLFYGMTAYLFARAVDKRGEKLLLAAAALVLIVLISFSRLYLGVHYLTDIVGGWAAGVTWLAACITARMVSQKRMNGDRAL